MKKSMLLLLFFAKQLLGQDQKIVGTINPNYTQITDLSNVYVDPDANNWKVVQNGQIPPEALVAGHEANGTKLYIARVNYKNGQLLGKVRQGDKAAMFAIGNKEVYFENYSVYVGKGKWITSIDRSSYNTVIPLGRDTTRRPLFAARSWHGGGLQNGSVDWDRKANIPYGGGSFRPLDFEILIREEKLTPLHHFTTNDYPALGKMINLSNGNLLSINPELGKYANIDQSTPYWNMVHLNNKYWSSGFYAGNDNFLRVNLPNGIKSRSPSGTDAVCVSINNPERLIIQDFNQDAYNNTINPNCIWKSEINGITFRLKNIFTEKYLYINNNKISLKLSNDSDKKDMGYWWISYVD